MRMRRCVYVTFNQVQEGIYVYAYGLLKAARQVLKQQLQLSLFWFYVG